jgi:hypothetical protein
MESHPKFIGWKTIPFLSANENTALCSALLIEFGENFNQIHHFTFSNCWLIYNTKLSLNVCMAECRGYLEQI